MNKRVSPAEFERALWDELQACTQEVTAAMKRGVERTAAEVNEQIQSRVTFGGTGKYKRAFTVKTTFEDNLNKRQTWYVKAPYARLTHLLEKGHALRNGGRSRAFPHIQYGETYAQENLARNIAEEIENGR